MKCLAVFLAQIPTRPLHPESPPFHLAHGERILMFPDVEQKNPPQNPAELEEDSAAVAELAVALAAVLTVT